MIVETRPRAVPPAESDPPELSVLTACRPMAILGSFEDEDGSVAVPPVFERCGAPSRVGAVG